MTERRLGIMIFLVIFVLIWISMGGSEFGTIPLGRYQYFDARYRYFGARCQISVSKSIWGLLLMRLLKTSKYYGLKISPPKY